MAVLSFRSCEISADCLVNLLVEGMICICEYILHGKKTPLYCPLCKHHVSRATTFATGSSSLVSHDAYTEEMYTLCNARDTKLKDILKNKMVIIADGKWKGYKATLLSWCGTTVKVILHTLEEDVKISISVVRNVKIPANLEMYLPEHS